MYVEFHPDLTNATIWPSYEGSGGPEGNPPPGGEGGCPPDPGCHHGSPPPPDRFETVSGDTFRLPFTLTRKGQPVQGDVRLAVLQSPEPGQPPVKVFEWTQDWNARNPETGEGLFHRIKDDSFQPGDYELIVYCILDADPQPGADEILHVWHGWLHVHHHVRD